MPSRAENVSLDPSFDTSVVATPTILGSVVLPGTEPAVSLVRRFARAMLGPAYPDLYELTIVASELFTNAVRHSRSGRVSPEDGTGQVTVTFRTGGTRLRLEMADQGGGGAPRLTEPDDERESGRGLHVVNALSLGWGAERRGSGTVVWAEFSWPGGCTVL